jgi:hypothetical protein
MVRDKTGELMKRKKFEPYKISDLIQLLHQLKDDYGNIPICITPDLPSGVDRMIYPLGNFKIIDCLDIEGLEVVVDLEDEKQVLILDSGDFKE